MIKKDSFHAKSAKEYHAEFTKIIISLRALRKILRALREKINLE
jgi:hypothetical protein